MVSGPDVSANLSVAAELLAEAGQQGASLAVLPENFAFLGRRERDKLEVAETESSGPMQDFLAAQAREQGLWIVGGSVPMQSSEPDRVYAACLVYTPDGQQAARYDKLHLFDVALPGGKESYQESASHVAGEQLQLVDTALGRLGLSVCYDLRFPELYRAYARQDAELLSVPSAFTRVTGEAHWEILLRARAIENLAWVLAADQGGEHAGGRQTFGGSMIVDPWGTVLARLDRGEGLAVAEIDLERQRALRQRFPALDHARIAISTDIQ